MTERFNQCINSIVFKYVIDQCSNYQNEGFRTAAENYNSNWRKFPNVKMHFPAQVKWRCLTLIQPYGAKPQRRLSEQKISTRLNII